MTPKQENLAEKIIDLHKQNDALFYWTAYYYENTSFLDTEFGENKFEQLQFVKDKLVELGLIEVINETGDRTQLLMPGFAFTTFNKKRIAEENEKRVEKIKSFPQRYWWLLAVVGYIAGLVSEPIRDMIFLKQKQDTNQSKQATPILTDTTLIHKKTFSSDTFIKNNLTDTLTK